MTDEVVAEGKEQIGGARWPCDRGGHAESIEDLGGGSRVFGVNLAQEAQHIAEPGVGGVLTHPGVKASEGGMVRDLRGEKGDPDEPPHHEVRRQEPLSIAVGTRLGPDADDLGAY